MLSSLEYTYYRNGGAGWGEEDEKLVRTYTGKEYKTNMEEITWLQCSDDIDRRSVNNSMRMRKGVQEYRGTPYIPSAIQVLLCCDSDTPHRRYFWWDANHSDLLVDEPQQVRSRLSQESKGTLPEAQSSTTWHSVMAQRTWEISMEEI